MKVFHVISDKDRTDGFRMRGDHGVHSSYGSATAFQICPDLREPIGCNLVPGQGMDAAQKAFNFCGQPGCAPEAPDSEAKFGAGHSRYANLHHVETPQSRLDRRNCTFNDVAGYVGVEHEEIVHGLLPNRALLGKGVFNGRSAMKLSGTGWLVSR